VAFGGIGAIEEEVGALAHARPEGDLRRCFLPVIPINKSNCRAKLGLLNFSQNKCYLHVLVVVIYKARIKLVHDYGTRVVKTLLDCQFSHADRVR
jgi:hypothetical protein